MPQSRADFLPEDSSQSRPEQLEVMEVQRKAAKVSFVGQSQNAPTHFICRDQKKMELSTFENASICQFITQPTVVASELTMSTQVPL